MHVEFYITGDPETPVQIEVNQPNFELEIKLDKELVGDIFYRLKEDGFFD